MKPSGIVTLLTDFGLDDAYVGAMKGAVLAVHARATLIDVTHGVRPFAVLQGAFLLDTAWRSFPVGTVHVAVVDPGVGTSRKAIAFRAADHIFTGPDNGLFTFLTEPISEMVELAAPPEAAPNELVALMGSSSRIEFALREGSAAARLHTAPGETLLVT